MYVYYICVTYTTCDTGCGRISTQCMPISEIKYFSIFCLGKFFYPRKLVVQNLYGFAWTNKEILINKDFVEDKIIWILALACLTIQLHKE